MLMFALVSCQSREERTISDLRSIAEKIENKSDVMTTEDWSKLEKEFEAVIEKAKDCEFTDEQLKEIGRLEAKITVEITKQAGKNLGKGLKDLFNMGKGLIEGISDELKDLDVN